VSRDGAGATVIDAGGEWIENYIAVNAATDGVVFGKSGKGFTVRNAAVGLYIKNGVAGVRVRGTIAETCHYGFLVGSLTGGGMAEGTVLKGNIAMSDGMAGFIVSDQSAVVSGNLAKASSYGFVVAGSSSTVVTKNLAVDNLGYGFLVMAGTTAPSFSKNAAIGNTDAGLFVAGTGNAAIVMKIKKNTFFGNGGRPQYPPANCGLVIQNSGQQVLTVNADGNYWGAASGPGGNPADAAGGSCSAGAVTLNLAEWATKEIKVAPPVVK
jgi:parallel beta-helix repeat protein